MKKWTSKWRNSSEEAIKIYITRSILVCSIFNALMNGKPHFIMEGSNHKSRLSFKLYATADGK